MSISTYNGELDPVIALKYIKKVNEAFPALNPGFFSLLIERMKAKGFSTQRVIDSVNNVIDNFHYPNPSMASFLSFDNRVKIYSYSEMVQEVDRVGGSTDNYAPIKINQKLFWVKSSDKTLFNLPNEI